MCVVTETLPFDEIFFPETSLPESFFNCFLEIVAAALLGARQEGAQIGEQRLHFLRLQDRRLDEQGRGPGGHERRIVFDPTLQLLAGTLGRGKRRHVGRLGLRSHRPLLPTGRNNRLAGVWRNVTLTYFRSQEQFALSIHARPKTGSGGSRYRLRPRPPRRQYHPWI